MPFYSRAHCPISGAVYHLQLYLLEGFVDLFCLLWIDKVYILHFEFEIDIVVFVRDLSATHFGARWANLGESQAISYWRHGIKLLGCHYVIPSCADQHFPWPSHPPKRSIFVSSLSSLACMCIFIRVLKVDCCRFADSSQSEMPFVFLLVGH